MVMLTVRMIMRSSEGTLCWASFAGAPAVVAAAWRGAGGAAAGAERAAAPSEAGGAASDDDRAAAQALVENKPIKARIATVRILIRAPRRAGHSGRPAGRSA